MGAHAAHHPIRMRPSNSPERKDPKNSDAKDFIRLEDLAPRDDVKGGTGKLRFGESTRPKSNRKFSSG